MDSPHPVNLSLHQSIKIGVHTRRDPREAVLSNERDIGQADAEAADAALAASIFHYDEYSIRQTKEIMRNRGVAVRL